MYLLSVCISYKYEYFVYYCVEHILIISVKLSLSEEPCSNDTSLSFYERGYLVHPADGTLYVCAVSEYSYNIGCFLSVDKGVTWYGE